MNRLFVFMAMFVLPLSGCENAPRDAGSRSSPLCMTSTASAANLTAKSPQQCHAPQCLHGLQAEDIAYADGVSRPIDVRGIPAAWKRMVLLASRHIDLPPQNRVFAALEEPVHPGLDSEIAFSLYEDGPDFAHRLGTYKIDRTGNVYRLDMLADDGANVWALLSIPPM